MFKKTKAEQYYITEMKIKITNFQINLLVISKTSGFVVALLSLALSVNNLT